MAAQMYFGTQSNMKWIAAPKVGVPLSMGRFTTETDFFRGASGLSQSVAGTKRYEFDFGLRHAAEIQHLMNVDSGAYGQTVYFLDPFAMQTNVLPIHWSAPWLAQYGVPNLMGKNKFKQAVTLTTTNTFDYPNYSAVMGADAGNAAWLPAESLTLWIPVPLGYTFHFGAHSNNTGANAVYVGITPDGGAEAVPTLLANNVATLTNYTYTPGVNSGVTLKLNGNPASTSYLSGLVAQILPVGQAAPTGSFIAGRGHSGCRIVGGVQELGSSATLDREQYTAIVKEFGNWADD